MIRCARWTVCLWLWAAALFAQVPLPAGDAVVETRQGRTYRGQLRGFDGATLHVTVREATGGEATLGVPAADVRRLAFPGDELVAAAEEAAEVGDHAEARALLEPLWRQRAPYLSLLPPAEVARFDALVEACLHTGGAIEAIGYARRLLALGASGDRALTLRAAEVQGHWQLGLVEEARSLAEAWCRETDPAGPSVFGWRVLAEIALAERRWEDARWLALTPVSFATFLPAPGLEACYALAAAAAWRAGDDDHALILFDELDARGLAWPVDLPALAEDRTRLHELRARRSAAGDDAENPSAGEAGLDGPPAEDLNLPLQQVRKLIARPGAPAP
jgi:hypothetical protein